MLGGLVGAFAYMLSYGWVKTTGVLDKIAGGKSTLGEIAGTDYPALIPGVPGEWLGIVLGIVFLVVAYVLPDRLVGRKFVAPAE